MTAELSIDEDALAEAYNRGLELEKSGRVEEAAAAYRECLKLDPDDHGGAAVRLASLGLGPVPEKAPDAYVETLFDQHAEDFDRILVDDLGYAIPLHTRQALLEHVPGHYDRMLDMGCGTGLSGGTMRDMADHITGFDISENMVAMADERDVYDDLYVGEAVAFVEEWDQKPFDLIVATDVLPYLGIVDALFAGVARSITPGGIFSFSTETLEAGAFEGVGYTVGRFQRFAHDPRYIREQLTACGFEVLAMDDVTVRHEQGEPVPGHLVIARRIPS